MNGRPNPVSGLVHCVMCTTETWMKFHLGHWEKDLCRRKWDQIGRLAHKEHAKSCASSAFTSMKPDLSCNQPQAETSSGWSLQGSSCFSSEGLRGAFQTCTDRLLSKCCTQGRWGQTSVNSKPIGERSHSLPQRSQDALGGSSPNCSPADGKTLLLWSLPIYC